MNRLDAVQDEAISETFSCAPGPSLLLSAGIQTAERCNMVTRISSGKPTAPAPWWGGVGRGGRGLQEPPRRSRVPCEPSTTEPTTVPTTVPS